MWVERVRDFNVSHTGLSFYLAEQGEVYRFIVPKSAVSR